MLRKMQMKRKTDTPRRIAAAVHLTVLFVAILCYTSAMWYVEEVNEQQLVLFSYIAIQDSTRKQCNSTLRCHLFFTKLNNQ